MNTTSLIATLCAAAALAACATAQGPSTTTIPRGPSLSYEQLLPNTYENPVWARNPRYAWQNGTLIPIQPQAPGAALAPAPNAAPTR